MEKKPVVTNTDNHVRIITIDNPSNLNALDNNIIELLSQALEDAGVDDFVRVVIITGSGKAFVAGADIASMAPMGPKEGGAFGMKGANLFRKIETLPKPVIAAVNGYALGGGCELALSCDIRIASEKAKFGQPEVSLGITPGFSGTVRLPSVIGVAKAKELIFTGRVIGAAEALSIGLVNQVVPDELLMEEAIKTANIIASNSPLAVKYSKESINLAGCMSREDAIKSENNFFSLCFASSEQKEGMKAFLEKRKPDFNNLK